MKTFKGLQIIVSADALSETDVRTFPESKHRSARIHKKLVKRFGGEFEKEPTAFQTPTSWIMHPVIYQKLKTELAIESFRPSSLFGGL